MAYRILARGYLTNTIAHLHSGKSSIVALLLRMLDPLPSLPSSSTPPSILIDETPLKGINRTALRQHLIAASQDAIFLPDGCGSSFRTQLDPWSAASAAEASAALKTVGLLDAIQDRGGIDAIANISTELSAGQKQMFALGRAVLRRRVKARKLAERGLEDGGVLLLDEITASVDRETEKMMEEVVWSEFKNYTVLMVTHSVDMAMSCDRVVILDRGRMVEIGEPADLRQKEGSWFRSLAMAEGR
jgi:ATP-binding cassette subfamily C (CFTR/MRP) protein 1